MTAMQALKYVAILMVALVFIGCTSVPIEQYAANQPRLALATFFNGPLTAHGIVKDRKGRVTRYFNVTMTGTWQADGRGELVEDFVWDDGEKQQRIWRFAPDGSGQIWASADDVKKAVPVMISGNALFMKYQLLVPVKDRKYWITVDDRMYLTDENVLINESKMSKFGFHVGNVTLTILKQ